MYLCVVHDRAEKDSAVENDDDSSDSDSQVIERLQAEKEKDLKKWAFLMFY